MSTTKKTGIASLSKPPKDMATPVLSLVEIGKILAKNADLEPGKYSLVVEFKLGNTTIRDPGSDGSSIPGMAVGIAGFGLAKTDTDGPLTVHYTGKPKRKATTKPKS